MFCTAPPVLLRVRIEESLQLYIVYLPSKAWRDKDDSFKCHHIYGESEICFQIFPNAIWSNKYRHRNHQILLAIGDLISEVPHCHPEHHDCSCADKSFLGYIVTISIAIIIICFLSFLILILINDHHHHYLPPIPAPPPHPHQLRRT